MRFGEIGWDVVHVNGVLDNLLEGGPLLSKMCAYSGNLVDVCEEVDKSPLNLLSDPSDV